MQVVHEVVEVADRDAVDVRPRAFAKEDGNGAEGKGEVEGLDLDQAVQADLQRVCGGGGGGKGACVGDRILTSSSSSELNYKLNE